MPGAYLLCRPLFFLIGFGGGVNNAGTSALVADISEESSGKRSANLSLLGVFYGIGALGVPMLIALLSSSWSFEKILQYIGFAIVLPPDLFCQYFLSSRKTETGNSTEIRIRFDKR